MKCPRTITTVLALGVLGACARSPASPTTTAALERPSGTQTNPAGSSSSERPVAGGLEHALDLAVEPSTLSALRASPRPSAKLLEPGTHKVWSAVESSPESSRGSVVLDDHRDDGARRLTLLCEGQQARVVAEIDSQGLHPVTVESTFVRPEHASEGADSVVPGLRLRAGEIVELRGEPKNGTQPIHYAAPPLEVSGLVSEEHVDVAYTPGDALPATDAVGTPSVLQRTVYLLDAPKGRAFGRIEVAGSDGDGPPGEQVRVVARRSGYALVVLDVVVAHAIGWVPEDALRTGPVGESGDVWGGLLSEEGKLIRLEKGTSLLGPWSERPVGVVTRDGEFACVEGCRGPHPMVSIEACGTNLTVRIGAPRKASA